MSNSGHDEEERDSFDDANVHLCNPHIAGMEQDILYHLALGSGSHDLVEMFSDVRYVCMGGTPKRMESFAYYLMDEIGYKLPAGTTLLDISHMSYRYSMFKVGPVLCFSHGMGIPSVGILLHEVIKLMYHAQCKNPIFFRLGTCGGIGIEGGNLVITESAVDGLLRPYLELPVLGKLQRKPAILDKQLANDLKNLRLDDDPFSITVGKTMCTYDFYEGFGRGVCSMGRLQFSGLIHKGYNTFMTSVAHRAKLCTPVLQVSSSHPESQGRLDGAFCDYTEEDKLNFLKKIHKENIVNMEMESLCFAALCHQAGIRGAVICVTLLNRLNGDQVATPKETLSNWQEYPQLLVARYIKKNMGLPVNKPQREYPQVVKCPKKHSMVRQESASFE